jgi:hypothetical protein
LGVETGGNGGVGDGTGGGVSPETMIGGVLVVAVVWAVLSADRSAREAGGDDCEGTAAADVAGSDGSDGLRGVEGADTTTLLRRLAGDRLASGDAVLLAAGATTELLVLGAAGEATVPIHARWWVSAAVTRADRKRLEQKTTRQLSAGKSRYFVLPLSSSVVTAVQAPNVLQETLQRRCRAAAASAGLPRGERQGRGVAGLDTSEVEHTKPKR